MIAFSNVISLLFVRFLEFTQHAVEVEHHWKEFAMYVFLLQLCRPSVMMQPFSELMLAQTHLYSRNHADLHV